MKFFLALVFFFFLSQPNVAASTLDFNEAFPYAWYSNQYDPAYCVHTYEQVIDNTSYLCKAAYIIPIPKQSTSYQTPAQYGRSYCWQFAFGGWYGGWGGSRSNAVILSQQFDFFTGLPTGYDNKHPCRPKQQVSPGVCNVDVQSIVSQAFSQKFPLDLFSNIRVTPVAPTCPSFTVSGQTFRLCYINNLTASLKYVLLLVFILTSVIAL